MSCVTFLLLFEVKEAVAENHPQVKLNNLDNLKCIDSAICPQDVITLTPISVNGAGSFYPPRLVGMLSSFCNGSSVKQRMKTSNGQLETLG